MSTIPNFATTPLYAESKDNGPSASVNESDKALKSNYFETPEILGDLREMKVNKVLGVKAICGIGTI